MLDVLAEEGFTPGVRRRAMPDEQACEHWLIWEAGAAIHLRRRPRVPLPSVTRVARSTALRVLDAGAGTSFALEDGRRWNWRGSPATHVLAPGTRLSARFAGRCAIALLCLSDDLMRRAAADLADPGPPAAAAALDAADPLLAALLERIGACCRTSSPGALAWVRSVAPVVALEVLTLGRRRGAGAPEQGATGTLLPAWRLRRLDGLIEAELDQPLSLERMAAAVGLSVFHFARCFRATLGITPQTYLLLCRCEKARGLLAAGGMPLSEIALACGFANQSHFTTVFKRIEGLTPGRWRQHRPAVPPKAG